MLGCRVVERIGDLAEPVKRNLDPLMILPQGACE